MVFRKENKTDAFQRQMSALRQQLGGDQAQEAETFIEPPANRADADPARSATGYGAEPTYGNASSSGFNFGGFGEASAQQQESPMDIAPAADEISAIPLVTDQTSVVAHDTTWKGEFESQGSVHIHGRVEGSVRARQDIFIAEEADVDASITATNVIIAGLIKGNIRCDSRFEVLPQGRVSGEIFAPTLVVHEGAHVNGNFRMGSPDQEQEAEAKPPTVVQRRAARGGV